MDMALLSHATRRVARLGSLCVLLGFSVNASFAQTISTLTPEKGNLEAGSLASFEITLASETSSYACAFEIDFGDGTPPEKQRVLTESELVVRVSHSYKDPGSYTVTAKGFFSFLDSGPSIKSLLPMLPCVGSKSVVVSVSPPEIICTAPKDETRVVGCPAGTVGSITQRRTFTCPGPTAGQWVVVTDSCKSPVTAPVEQVPEGGAAALIAQGWGAFIGRAGGVEEFEALRITSEGVRIAKVTGQKNTMSVGLNNLAVFHLCSADVRIRDRELGRKIAGNEVGINSYSSDNYIWGVFLRREQADIKKFLSFLDTYERNHPVTAYIKKSSGRLPKDTIEAVKFLQKEAAGGDYLAAQWVAFYYECGTDQIDIPSAREWMALASSNARKSAAPRDMQRAIDERLSRLVILGKRF